MSSLIQRLARASVEAIRTKRDPKFSRAAARIAAHWAIAVLYQKHTGQVAKGTSAEAFEALR